MRVCIEGAPEGWELVEPPAGLSYVASGAEVDVLMGFFGTEDSFAERLAAMGQSIFPEGMLWVAWPRKAAGHISDMSENLIRQHALPLGLVDVKVAALDHDWSGLKLVWRKERRQ